MQTVTDIQNQLTELKARKAKADAMGPAVIAQSQAMYDDIVVRIRELEAELALLQDNPLVSNHCMAVLPLTFMLFQCKWMGIECRTDIDKRYGQELEQIGAAFSSMIGAIQADDVSAHVEAWTALDTVVDKLVAQLKGEQTAKQLGFTEMECDGSDRPFEQKCTA